MVDRMVGFTLGEVVAQVSVPMHKVEYLIRSRGIRPVARVGTFRLFSPAQVEQIRRELAGIGERRKPLAQAGATEGGAR